ncbi:hypothetical protein [Enterobacter hormaechei]|nr:hypothetical protein [Enterobacter hormaechei]MDR9983881.1 hypothetical protein [Enterobacter hormaechei subsp. steigerwaltii]
MKENASGENVIQDIFRFIAHSLAALGLSAAASGTGSVSYTHLTLQTIE